MYNVRIYIEELASSNTFFYYFKVINTITKGKIQEFINAALKERKEEYLEEKNEDYIDCTEQFYKLFKGA